MNTITFKSSIFEVTLDEHKVKTMYEEHQFLVDAVCYLLNPKAVSDCWDIPFGEHSLNDLKAVLEKSGLDKDFVNTLVGERNFTLIMATWLRHQSPLTQQVLAKATKRFLPDNQVVRK
jgi:hypothetical protein